MRIGVGKPVAEVPADQRGGHQRQARVLGPSDNRGPQVPTPTHGYISAKAGFRRSSLCNCTYE